jgi:hypothetical protein
MYTLYVTELVVFGESMATADEHVVSESDIALPTSSINSIPMFVVSRRILPFAYPDPEIRCPFIATIINILLDVDDGVIDKEMICAAVVVIMPVPPPMVVEIFCRIQFV